MELVYPWNSHICAQTLLSILLELPHLCADTPQHPPGTPTSVRRHSSASSWNTHICARTLLSILSSASSPQHPLLSILSSPQHPLLSILSSPSSPLLSILSSPQHPLLSILSSASSGPSHVCTWKLAHGMKWSECLFVCWELEGNKHCTSPCCVYNSHRMFIWPFSPA